MKTVTCTFNRMTHKVVPIEPTAEMNSAQEKYEDSFGLCDCGGTNEFDSLRAYSIMLAAAPEYPADSGWISVDERLPDLHICVSLLNNKTWMNTGGDFEVNWHASGWLCEFGHKYWNIIGESRAQTLDSVTHWMPLPTPPINEI